MEDGLFLCGWLFLAGVVAAENLLPNGDFSQGTKGWQLKNGELAGNTVSVSKLEGRGGNALLFNHLTTDSSSANADLELAPNAHYLLSFAYRAPLYLRVGMGLYPSVTSGELRSYDRYKVEHMALSGPTRARLPFLTDASGKARVTLNFAGSAGKVYIYGVSVQLSSRAELRRILSNGYGDGVKAHPVPENTAAARVWFDEFPVTDRSVSQVTFQTSDRLGKDTWLTSGQLICEIPSALKVSRLEEPGETLTGETLPDGYARYSIASADMLQAGEQSWARLVISSPEALRFAGDHVRFYASWAGGQQPTLTAPITRVTVPQVKQPQKIRIGITAYGYTAPSIPDYYTFVKSLGFTFIDCWGVPGDAVPKYRAVGIDALSDYSGMFTVFSKIKDYPDAFVQGYRDQKPRESAICPSTRGGLFKEYLAQVREIAKQGFVGINFDDEHYVDWRSLDTCVCERCQRRWHEWMSVEHPELEAVSPEQSLADPIGHREQYELWFDFRAMLLREWYIAAKKVFLHECQRRPVGRDARAPWFSSYTGCAGRGSVKNSAFDPAIMGDTIEKIFPMLYIPTGALRRQVSELVAATSRETAGAALCAGQPSEYRWVWAPGEIQAQMLEVLFARGNGGILIWTWSYTNARILAEIAQVTGVIAENEEIFWDGETSAEFSVDKSDQRAAAIETNEAGLLLVGNYGDPGITTVKVTRRGTGRTAMVDLIGNADITWEEGEQERRFTIPTGQARVWRWQK